MFAFRTHSIFWGGESVLSAGLGNMFVEPEVEQEDAFSNFNHRTQDTPGTIRPAQVHTMLREEHALAHITL